MSLVWKIAFRNLKEHKTKTLIIGVIIAIGITVLVVGNSLMDTAAKGIKATYIESYTGDIVITGKHRGRLSIVGMEGAQAMDEAVPRIPDYDRVYQYVAAHPAVAEVNPQATAMAMVDFGKNRSFAQLFGIKPSTYTAMFPNNIQILQGRMLKEGEQGIILSEKTASQLEKDGVETVAPGEKLLLTGMSQGAGVKVREVPIRGIFRFRHSNPQLDYVSLLDIVNLRALAGMNLSFVSEADLTKTEKALFDDVDEDALFGGAANSLFSGDVVEDVDVDRGAAGASGFKAEGLLQQDVKSASPGHVSSGDRESAWHFLLVKLKEGTDPAPVIAAFQSFFDEQEIDATAAPWLDGAGSMAMLAYGTKNVFNVVVLVIAIVAVIIIMNTLVISVTERTTEIGTMRALGAQKKFVRRMIAWETVITAGIFGLIGIVLGCMVLVILNLTGVEAPNVFFEVLFGGKVLHPVPSLGAIVTSLVVVVVIGVVSSLYPVSIALRTKPVKAMQGS